VEQVERIAEVLEEQPRDINRELDKLDYFEDMLTSDVEDL
jgi:hypothetical protein